MSVKKQIKKATKPTETKVDGTYTSGSYAKQNTQVEATANQNINNATKRAESAYQAATANNANRAAQSHSTNAMTTKQIGTKMKREGYSLTNRNVAGAAAARNASGINTAQANANRNAQLTRDTARNAAKQSAYSLAAKANANNVERDIARSTQLSKRNAEQSYQHAEAKKRRDLKNAIQKREDQLANKKRKYEKGQRQLKAYTNTLSTRYQSVKSVDKAIKKMKKNKKASYQKTKLAYLQALRVQLKQAKKSSSGGSGRSGGGRRGGYGRRGYGSSGGSYGDSLPTLNNGSGNNKGKTINGNSKAKIAYNKKIAELWQNRGRTLIQPNEKAKDKKAAATKKKQKGGVATSARWRGATIRNASSRKK